MTTYSYTSNSHRIELRFKRDLELLEGQYTIATLFINGLYDTTFEGYTIAEAIEETEREYPNDLFFKMALKAETVLSAPEPEPAALSSAQVMATVWGAQSPDTEPAPPHDSGMVYDQPKPALSHDPALEKVVKGVRKIDDVKAWRAESGDSLYEAVVKVTEIWILRGYERTS